MTCRTGGKLKVMEDIKAETGETEITMIGDGITDAETIPQVVGMSVWTIELVT